MNLQRIDWSQIKTNDVPNGYIVDIGSILKPIRAVYAENLYFSGTSVYDELISGGTFSGNSLIIKRNDGSEIEIPITGYTDNDTYVSGMTFNPSNYDLTIVRNDGVSFVQSLSILASDLFVTGGTYNPVTGDATFTNNVGGSFVVSGFMTGFTDVVVTAFTYSNNVLTITNSDGSFYSAVIDTMTGLTINGILSATTVNANVISGGTFYGDGSNLNGITDNYVTGMTLNPITFDLVLKRNDGVEISESLLSLSSDKYVTGGTYNPIVGEIVFVNNSGDTFTVTGITGTQITGFTYDDNKLTISDSNGNQFITFINDMTGLTINGNFIVTGQTQLNSVTAKTISNVDYIDFNTSYQNGAVPGRLSWSEEDGTLELGMRGGTVIQQIGEEIYYQIRNNSGSIIQNGQVIRAIGTIGNSTRIIGDLMIADGSIPYHYTLGIATENIGVGADGFITEFGIVRGVNTTGSLYGETWVDGQILYVSETVPGGLTKNQPLNPNLKIQIAIVIHAHSNGSMFVRPFLGYNLGDLHDIQTTGETNGDLISYNDTLGTWRYTKSLVGNFNVDGNFWVGTGTPIYHNSVLTYFNSNNKGIVFPNLTTIQKTGITSPQTSLFLYDTTISGYSYYNGSSWVNLLTNIYGDSNYVPLTRQLTINNITYDLSNNREWSIPNFQTIITPTGSTTATLASDTLTINTNDGLSLFATGKTLNLGVNSIDWSKISNPPTFLTNLNGITTGGVVTWTGVGLIFDVSSAIYYIDNVSYNSPYTQITLNPADITFSRLDVIAVNTNGQVVIKTGIPAADPVKAQVDPITEIELTTILVSAGATSPGNVSREIIYDENTEPLWDPTSTGVTVNFNSTSNPYNGSICTLTNAGVNNNFIEFNRVSGGTVTNYNTFKFAIRLVSSWTNNARLGISFYSGATQISNELLIQNGTYGFSRTLTGNYQLISIPLSDWGFTSTTFNRIRFRYVNNIPSFNLDVVELQGGLQYITSDTPAFGVIQTSNGSAVSTAPNDILNINALGGISLSASGKTLTISGATQISTITSLNTLTSVSQTFVVGSGGTDFNIVSSGSTHTFNIPDASNTIRGVVNIGDQNFSGRKIFTNNSNDRGTGDGYALRINGTWSGLGGSNDHTHLLFDPQITAKAAGSTQLYGLRITPSLTASSNSQTIVGVEISPTFTAGGGTNGMISLRATTINTNSPAIQALGSIGSGYSIISSRGNGNNGESLLLGLSAANQVITGTGNLDGILMTNQSGQGTMHIRGGFNGTTMSFRPNGGGIHIDNLNGSGSESSIFSLNSINRGFLPPRMTQVQKTGITSPAIGLMVYDTTLSGYSFYNGVSWNSVGGGIWGSINGTLSNQIDLQTELNNKSNINHTHVSSNILDFNVSVRNTTLTGYTIGANTQLATTDTILQAFGKVQSQINNLIPSQTGNSGRYLATNGFSLSWSNLTQARSSQHNTTPTTVFSLIRPITSGGFWPGVVDFVVYAYNTNPINIYTPWTQLDIRLKSTQNSTEVGDITVMSLRDNGNVGIGTTTPTTRLMVLAPNPTPGLGLEILSNSSWTSSGWTGSWSGGWTHTTGNTNTLSLSVSAVVGTRYLITWTMTGRTAGTVQFGFGNSFSRSLSTSGFYGLVANTTAGFTVTPTSDFNGTLIISLKQYGNVLSTPLATIASNDTNGDVGIQFRSDSSGNIGIGTNALAINIPNSNYAQLNSGTSGLRNIAIGSNALVNNWSGDINTAIGNSALSSNTSGSSNIAIGEALVNNISGAGNIGIGAQSLGGNTTGGFNIGIGQGGGADIGNGNRRTTIGHISGVNSWVLGDDSVSIGFNSSVRNQGIYNTSIGSNAGGHASNLTTYNSNYGVYIGGRAGIKQGGDFNINIGYESGFDGVRTAATSLGNNNINIGRYAGGTQTAGSNNIAIGFNTLLLSTTGSDQFAIGGNSIRWIISDTNGGHRRWVFNGTNLDVTSISNPSATFEINGTSGGILIPRLTTTQRNTITSPSNGLLIYNTDTNTFDYRKNTQWAPLSNQEVIQTITGTTTLNNETTLCVVNPSSLVSGMTITLPTSPYEGQFVKIVFGGLIAAGSTVVTSITISGSNIIQSTTPADVLSGDSLAYIRSGSYWYRVF